MPVSEMPQFMRQNCIDFIIRQFRQQGIVKNHPFAGTEPCEVGIRMRTAFTTVHDVKSFGGKAAPLHQGSDAGFQCLVTEWREFVEQRCNETGVDQQQEQVEPHPHNPSPKPPQTAGRVHDPQNQGGNRQSYHCSQTAGFE